MEFRRTIGSWGLLFAGISSVIGSGWLFGPLFAAQVAGPAAVISWILGGLLMLIIAFTFAELSTTLPVAGGMIQFAHKSHGPLLSFIIGWMLYISSIAVAPVETLAIVQYAANYVPSLMNQVGATKVLSHIGILISAFVMFIMCFLNYYGAKLFSRANSFITILKLIVPIVTVLLLITSHFHASNFVISSFAPNGWHGILAALPLGGVIYSFIGSNTIIQLAAETSNPKRNIPFALIGTILFCILLYAALQIAFVGALPPHALANGWQHLQFSGDNGPFAGIMLGIGLTWMIYVIYADALISPFGTGFVFTASTARVAYGLGEISFLPKGLTKLTKRGVPLRGLITNYFIGLLLLLPFPAWQQLASFIISCFIISYIIGPISMVTLRNRADMPSSSFQLPFAKWIGLIGFYICNLLIFWTGWTVVSKMMVAIVIGLCFFAYYSYKHTSKSECVNQCKRCWWLVPYFSGITLISYLGTFGHGRNILPFGIDFVVIAAFTAAIFFAAVKKAITVTKTEALATHTV